MLSVIERVSTIFRLVSRVLALFSYLWFSGVYRFSIATADFSERRLCYSPLSSPRTRNKKRKKLHPTILKFAQLRVLLPGPKPPKPLLLRKNGKYQLCGIQWYLRSSLHILFYILSDFYRPMKSYLNKFADQSNGLLFYAQILRLLISTLIS